MTLVGPKQPKVTTKYVDFTTGQEITNHKPLGTNLTNAAVRKYLQIMEENKYDEMLLPGYWKFPPGNEIPEDLLLPIGEFVKKYDIEPLLSRMWSVTGGGVGSRGDFNILTLTVMQAFAPPLVRAVLGEVQRYQPVNGNMELYNKIARLLGPDILFNSTVSESERSNNNIKLVVQSEQGVKTNS